MRHAVFIVSAMTWLAAAGAASAQTLGDVARREEERRKAVSSGKVYTNDNLKPDPGSRQSAPAQPAAAVTQPAAAPSQSGVQGDAKEPAPEQDPKRDEKAWRDR